MNPDTTSILNWKTKCLLLTFCLDSQFDYYKPRGSQQFVFMPRFNLKNVKILFFILKQSQNHRI